MILIRLSNRLAAEDYMLTISHEMIHAYQYYIGDLIRHARTNFTWRGVNFRNVHQMEHAKRPWEIEAIDPENAHTASYIDFKIIITYFLKGYHLRFIGLGIEKY